KEKRARTDLHGDPLPPGAQARLGTVRFRHTASVRGAGFSSDGKILITGDYTGLILFWDAATGKELRRFQLPGTLTSVGRSPDGKILASADFRGLHLWDLATGKQLREWKAPQMRSLVFSPDGKTLATYALAPHVPDNLIYLWDTAGGEKRHELKGHRDEV